MQNEVAGGAATGIACQNVSLPDPTEFSSSPYVIGGYPPEAQNHGSQFYLSSLTAGPEELKPSRKQLD